MLANRDNACVEPVATAWSPNSPGVSTRWLVRLDRLTPDRDSRTQALGLTRMPTQVRRFARTRFSRSVVSAAILQFRRAVGEERGRVTGTVVRGPASWHFTDEGELLDEYAAGAELAALTLVQAQGQLDLTVDRSGTVVAVHLPRRAQVDRVMQIFGDAPGQAAPRVFLGHGPTDHWRVLADLLRMQHGIDVVTYEDATRGGVPVLEVLEQLATQAPFALLVHTSDYLDQDGVGHASDNVVYETGLLQALLGPRRAVVVREHGCANYANISGLNQLRFPPGQIAGVVGDVMAVLRREFPSG